MISEFPWDGLWMRFEGSQQFHDQIASLYCKGALDPININPELAAKLFKKPSWETSPISILEAKMPNAN
jgi:hypothetical protein